MKKTKCDLSRWYIFPAISGIFGLLHLFGITFWTRFGWQEPTIQEGLYWLAIAAVSYALIRHFCAKANIVKCTSCKEVFSETDTQYKDCPNCGGKLVEIKKYYEKSNKAEEPISDPHAVH